MRKNWQAEGMTEQDLYGVLLDEFWGIPLFDVHSHFCQEGGMVDDPESYLSAWTQPEVPPPGLTEAQIRDWREGRWAMKRTYWFSRACGNALRELYATDDSAEMARLMNGVRARGLEASIDWMRGKSNVENIVVDSNPDLAAAREGILSTYRLDARGVTWRSCELEDVLEGEEERIKGLKEAGGVHCFKIPVAYDRSLRMEDVSLEEAARAARKEPEKRNPGEQKAIEDYIFRHFMRRAGRWSMPVEIHTGFGWAIHDRPLRLSEADPENLLPVLENEEFRRTQFILFHGGYPFTSKMGYMAGAFSNVNLDFTCLSPESWRMLKRALHEWIDIVPLDRMVAGSDGSYEWLYFGARLNRECLAQVLAEKVESEYMDLEMAVSMGRHILRDNGRRIFGLE